MWVIYLFMLFGHQLNTYLHVLIVLLTVGTGENVDKEKDFKPHGKTNPPPKTCMKNIVTSNLQIMWIPSWALKLPLLSRRFCIILLSLFSIIIFFLFIGNIDDVVHNSLSRVLWRKKSGMKLPKSATNFVKSSDGGNIGHEPKQLLVRD